MKAQAAGALALALSCFPCAVPAQEVTELETIEVTADKRLKSQRDIPGSVGAVSGQQLEEMRAQGMRDYFKLIPGVVYLDQGNEESVPIIRGIGTSISFLQSTPRTTGVFLDDMSFGDLFLSLSTPDMNPFDLERVEILKGPQGTLFGAQALAGAVRYIVQKPSHGLWEGKLSETVTATEGGGGLSHVTAGAINVPLFGDAVAVRAVGLERKDPGLYDMGAHDANGNALRDDPDADRTKQTSGRILASWNATDNLKLSAFYFGQETHQDEWGQADNARKPQSDHFPFPSPRDHDFAGGNLLATYDFSWARLLSSTNRIAKYNYFVLPLDANFGLGNQNQNEAVEILGDEIRGYSQEFRLMSPEGDDGNWEWLVGASYLDHDQDVWEYANLGPAMPHPTSPDQFTEAEKKQSAIFATWTQAAVEKGLFGEVTRRLGAHWEATVGARAYRTRQITDAVACGTLVAAEFNSGNPDCILTHDDQNTSGLNPKFSIRYLHNRNAQLYALAAKGFQFGGVQIAPRSDLSVAAAQGAGFTFGTYKSSELWNYESGIRTEWLDRRVRFDLAFFYLDWRDLQLTVQINVPGTQAPFYSFIANVGRAHSEGVESALAVIPFTGAKWTSSAAWITAVTDELFDTQNPDGGVKPGARMPGTPRFAWSNVISYEHALPYFNRWTIGPVLTHSHIGSSPDAIRPTGTVGGYDTLDARIALVKPDSRFLPELSLGVHNLTDVRGVTFHQFIPASTPTGTPVDLYHFVPPRTAMLSLSMKY